MARPCPVPLTLTRAEHADIAKAATLIHDYIHEMSVFMEGGVLSSEQRADAFGMMTAYWELDDHHPFLILSGTELAGLAFVRRYPGSEDVYDMGQFFIVDEFKGMGLGREAFRQTLVRFPGDWLVRVLPGNTRAFEFWKKVAAEVTGNNFSLSLEPEKNTLMHFIRFRVECE